MDDARFVHLISGAARGLPSSIARGGLRILSAPYGVGVRLRNAAFDAGFRRPQQADVPVISVGNITTGGTGKTPFVAFLAGWFGQRNVRVCLISRGYGALDGAANDEKLVLDSLCPGVPHVQHPDRVASARTAVEQHGAEVLILDDGFQHRRLGRDLDIVLVDALNPWGYGHLLPRGLLREPLSGIERADLVVLTRADLCEAGEKQRIRARLAAIRGTGECVEVAFPPSGLINAGGQMLPLESLASRPLAAFCGIGNPEGFRHTLRQAGADLRDDAFRAFRDHHHYTLADLDEVGALARRSSAALVVTTLKDLVKIDRVELGGVPLRAVMIGTRILEGVPLLETALERISVQCRTDRGTASGLLCPGGTREREARATKNCHASRRDG
jgi:tetraacyldisaccharide 4'-kinase